MIHAPHVTAIVLSWNGRERTLACLRSLALVTYRPFSVLVVDNGSSDGSADAVAIEHPQAILVRLHDNLGFAGGMNAGIKAAFAAGADAVVLLNNDMEVDAGFVEPLVAVSSADPRCAAACAQILFAGEPPRIWYAGASSTRSAATVVETSGTEALRSRLPHRPTRPTVRAVERCS